MKKISVKMISLLLALVTLLSAMSLLAACGDDGEVTTEAPVDNTTEPAPETEPEVEIAPIMFADLENYFIVRPERTASDLHWSSAW